MAARLKADWNEAYRGGELGKVALLSGGVTWTNLGLMSAEDAQLVSHREFSVQDVARIFSVPLFMLGDGVRATYASARESSRQFAMQALHPGSRSCSAPSSSLCTARGPIVAAL